MTNPYTLPAYSYDSTNSVNSAPTAFYTMKMYETPVEPSNRGTRPTSTSTSSSPSARYLQPQEIPYHHQQISSPSPQPTTKEPGAAGSAADIIFTNPFLPPTSPSPTTSAATNISNQHANTAGTAFQPLYATFGMAPVFVSCPYCQHTDETIAVPAVGAQSILCCMVLPVVGLFFKSKWDTRHQCKCCHNIIGTHYAQ